MAETTQVAAKRITKTRKKALSSGTTTPSLQVSAANGLELSFTQLADKIAQAKIEFLDLLRGIEETKQNWKREQQAHEFELQQRASQEDLERKREQETYGYETQLRHKQVEDAFLEKRAGWERELEVRKEELAREKEELQDLRKQVAGFETEKERAIKEACNLLEKTLRESFATEQRIREQEFRAQVEVLNLRIENLTQENTRQAKEIEAIRRSLEDATRQLKDIAVKVIESSGSSQTQATGVKI